MKQYICITYLHYSIVMLLLTNFSASKFIFPWNCTEAALQLSKVTSALMLEFSVFPNPSTILLQLSLSSLSGVRYVTLKNRSTSLPSEKKKCPALVIFRHMLSLKCFYM